MSDEYFDPRQVAIYDGDVGCAIVQELRGIRLTLDLMFDRIETQGEVLAGIRRELGRR